MVPSEEEKKIRPCYSEDSDLKCFHCEKDDTGKLHCNFNMAGDPGLFRVKNSDIVAYFHEMVPKRFDLNDEQLKEMPCNYHITQKEFADSLISH